jgi:predicted metalloendopeptidase
MLLPACQKARTVKQPELPSLKPSGLDLGGFDRNVRPQDDFFAFVNGEWVAKTTIPPDKTSWGSFVQLADRSRQQLHELVEDLLKHKQAPGSNAALVAALYRSYLDEATVEKLGLQPLRGQLDALAGLETAEELAGAFADSVAKGGFSPISCFVTTDQKDSNRYALYLSQSGIGLPDKDYFFNEGPQFERIREEYGKYLARLFELAGMEWPRRRAEAVYALQKRLAGHQWSRVQNRDREKTYNPRPYAALSQQAADFPMQEWLAALAMGPLEEVVVRQPDYLEALGPVFNETGVEVWRDYLAAGLLDAYAPYLHTGFQQAHFQFRKQILSGVEQQQPRWELAIDELNDSIGQALGQLYVARHFKPESKARMERLVANLVTAFGQRIDQLDWMSAETKVRAREKLAQFNTKIGYPDRWRDFSTLRLDPADLVGNLRACAEFNFRYNAGKLGKAVDRLEWFMSPQTVNAYYSPSFNEIVFPAAILQPPFFHPDADDAVNYGAIGGVIGHEISHGFDDQGRKSDGMGNMRDWWQQSDAAEFESRAAQLVQQYGQYEALPGLMVNGKLTLGENIGDLGGLTTALEAYRLSLGEQPSPVLDGFTGEQRVFLGWAQVWRIAYRDEALRNRLLTDPHSPGRYRVNGVVCNIESFYQAFQLKEGDGLYRAPEQRVRIW